MQETDHAGNDSLSPTPFFDPWLVSRNRLAPLAEDIAANIERKAKSFTRRDAVLRRQAVVSGVMSNILDARTRPAREVANRIAVPTSRLPITRYDNPTFPRRQLAETLQALEHEGLIIKHPAIYKRMTTEIEPTPALLEMFDAEGVSALDIGRYAGAEPIWLTARTGKRNLPGLPENKVLVPYVDTEETHALRDQMDSINAFLNEADLRFNGQGLAPVSLRRTFALRRTSDPHAFNLNGRLFNGWWMNISKDQRHLIVVQGEPVADFDFSGMFVRLAYCKVGRPLPAEVDPYAIPGLEGHRAAAKLAFLSLLGRTGTMRRIGPELRELLPEGWNARRVNETFAHHHRPIAHLFGRDCGIELMHLESTILTAVLTRLNAAGVAGLPMHDGLLTPHSKGGLAADIMAACSKEVLGVALPVVEKPIMRPILTHT